MIRRGAWRTTLKLLFFAVAAASACAPAPRVRSDQNQHPRECPAGLTAVAPPEAESILFLRPRTWFSDPRLASILAHSFDEASEAAMIRRAERDGFDARTIDRAVVARTPQATIYYAAGPLDAARVTERLWERLLLPRTRHRDGPVERIEGVLGRHLVALVLDGACRTAAFVEGRDTRSADRVLVPNTQRDPDALLLWRSRRVPDPLANQSDPALIHQVGSMELRIDSADAGLGIRFELTGHFDAGSTEHMRAALRALVGSPLGDLSGAIQWLDAVSAVTSADAEHLLVRVTIPWRAALALADALRGDTSVGERLEKSTAHSMWGWYTDGYTISSVTGLRGF